MSLASRVIKYHLRDWDDCLYFDERPIRILLLIDYLDLVATLNSLLEYELPRL